MDPSAVPTPHGLAADLGYFVRDWAKPGLVGAVCEILSRAGMKDFELIRGLGAGPADDFVRELRALASAIELGIDFAPLAPTLRAVWVFATAGNA